MSNETIFTIVIGLAISGVVILWVAGIDYMKENHPEYKGKDFFNEEEDEEK
jgi:hypothetical protein